MNSLPVVRLAVLLLALLCSGCDYPPDEVELMRQQLQAEISRGQVYVIHSKESLSYVIRNSEFTGGPEAGREQVVRTVEKAVLEFLAKYRNYGDVKIYFLGDGTTGINKPYRCRAADNACSKSVRQAEAGA